MDGYVGAFRRAVGRLRGIEDFGVRWWPRSQPETTALAWAIGLELTPAETRWVYSCWGTRPPLKAAVLDAYGIGHCPGGERTLPTLKARQWGFYPRQYLVDFSTYAKQGNAMLLAMESEAHADHGVGNSFVSPEYDYNWDFAKLLYLPAALRVFVARVRHPANRELVWNDLTGILRERGAPEAFHLDSPVVVYMFAPEKKGINAVGVWRNGKFERAELGNWVAPSSAGTIS